MSLVEKVKFFGKFASVALIPIVFGGCSVRYTVGTCATDAKLKNVGISEFSKLHNEKVKAVDKYSTCKRKTELRVYDKGGVYCYFTDYACDCEIVPIWNAD